MGRIAALILIGNEILSGRTRDDNIQFLATNLGELGIPCGKSASFQTCGKRL